MVGFADIAVLCVYACMHLCMHEYAHAVHYGANSILDNSPELQKHSKYS